MNIRNVLRTYSLLRQLTDDESALLETLRGATDAERELLVETLAPQKSTTKRAPKKSASKSASKSPRAASLAERVGGTLASIAKTVGSSDENARKIVTALCSACGNAEDYEDHFKPSPHYHEFDTGKSPAPRAGAKSSTNGGATVTTVNSEDETVSAGAVAGGSSE